MWLAASCSCFPFSDRIRQCCVWLKVAERYDWIFEICGNMTALEALVKAVAWLHVFMWLTAKRHPLLLLKMNFLNVYLGWNETISHIFLLAIWILLNIFLEQLMSLVDMCVCCFKKFILKWKDDYIKVVIYETEQFSHRSFRNAYIKKNLIFILLILASYQTAW